MSISGLQKEHRDESEGHELARLGPEAINLDRVDEIAERSDLRAVLGAALQLVAGRFGELGVPGLAKDPRGEQVVRIDQLDRAIGVRQSASPRGGPEAETAVLGVVDED